MTLVVIVAEYSTLVSKVRVRGNDETNVAVQLKIIGTI